MFNSLREWTTPPLSSSFTLDASVFGHTIPHSHCLLTFGHEFDIFEYLRSFSPPKIGKKESNNLFLKDIQLVLNLQPITFIKKNDKQLMVLTIYDG